MSQGTEYGVVAALEREVRTVVRDWRRTSVAGLTVFEGEGAVLVCAGTGMARAEAAARMLVEKYAPKTLLSVGFAGGCVAELSPGALLVPAVVVESASGKSLTTVFGEGTLVTLDKVAEPGLKQCSAARFGARAVDMEAYAVGAVAAETGREFAAIKAVSDAAADDLGFLDGFVTPEGFATGRFVAHIAVRPALWPKVKALQHNSRLAAEALAGALKDCLKDGQEFSARFRTAIARP